MIHFVSIDINNYSPYADINQDGLINVIDIISLVNIIFEN